MSSTDADTVRATARLARLDVRDDEIDALGEQFARILTAFETLAELDVEGVEPTSGAPRLAKGLRSDEPRPSLDRERVLELAPRRQDGFFEVPRTVGGES